MLRYGLKQHYYLAQVTIQTLTPLENEKTWSHYIWLAGKQNIASTTVESLSPKGASRGTLIWRISRLSAVIGDRLNCFIFCYANTDEEPIDVQ